MPRRPDAHLVCADVDLHCLRWPGSGGSWVLLHGFGDAASCWDRTVQALPDDVDAIAVDARNHGRSGTGPGGPHAHVADVVAVLEHFELDTAGLIGHSVGARTAALVAAARPDLVDALVLVDPPWRPGAEDAAPELAADARAAIVADIVGTSTMDEESLAALLASRHPDWDDADGAPWLASKRALRPEAADDLTPTAWGPILDELTCPTLLVRGGDGGIVDDGAEARIRRRNPHVEVTTIAGAGHNVHREDLDGFVAVLADWIARHV